MANIDVEIDDAGDTLAVVKAKLEAELREQLNGTVICPEHGPITGMAVELDDDLQSAELVGQVCCEAGRMALVRELAGD